MLWGTDAGATKAIGAGRAYIPNSGVEYLPKVTPTDIGALRDIVIGPKHTLQLGGAFVSFGSWSIANSETRRSSMLGQVDSWELVSGGPPEVFQGTAVPVCRA